MISGQDLMLDLQGRMKMLESALRQLGIRGGEYAKAEYQYRIALRQNILKERSDGTPVSIISDVCRGLPEIASLKMQRDIAEATYKAAMEACNVYKLEIRVLENQIEREYKN